MSQLSLSILTWTDTNFKVTRGLCIFRTQQRKEERRESNRTMLTSSSKPADPIDLFSFLCSIHVQSACLIICFLYPLLAKVPHNSISDTPLSSTLTHVHKSWWLLQEAFLEHFFFSFSHWLALVAKAPNFSIYFFIYFQGWKRRRRRRAQLWTPLRVGQLAFLDSNEGKETNWVKRWGKSCVSVNFRTERHPATPYHFPPPPHSLWVVTVQHPTPNRWVYICLRWCASSLSTHRDTGENKKEGRQKEEGDASVSAREKVSWQRGISPSFATYKELPCRVVHSPELLQHLFTTHH